jgi:hypothetical protein
MKKSKKSKYVGRIFIFTNKSCINEFNSLKQIFLEITEDENVVGEIKIDSKPFLYDIMKLRSRKSTCPQVFFNSTYFGVQLIKLILGLL